MISRGVAPTAPPERARDHLRALAEEYHVGRKQLARATGVGESTIHRILSGTATRVRTEDERRILATTIRDPRDLQAAGADGYTTPYGAYRRLRALQAIGYSAAFLAPLLGVHPAAVRRWRRGGMKRIAVGYHLRIAAVYKRLHTVPGQSEADAAAARERDYPPPICWDDDGDMDDRSGRPKGHKGWLEMNPPLLAGAA